MGAPVGRLKQRPGIADRPAVHLIRESHIEKRGRTLADLGRPARTAVGGRENRAQRADDGSVLLVRQHDGVQRGARSTGLILSLIHI